MNKLALLFHRARCIHKAVCELSLKDKRKMFTVMRNKHIDENSLFIGIGLTAGEFAVGNVVGTKKRNN